MLESNNKNLEKTGMWRRREKSSVRLIIGTDCSICEEPNSLKEDVEELSLQSMIYSWDQTGCACVLTTVLQSRGLSNSITVITVCHQKTGKDCLTRFTLQKMTRSMAQKNTAMTPVPMRITISTLALSLEPWQNRTCRIIYGILKWSGDLSNRKVLLLFFFFLAECKQNLIVVPSKHYKTKVVSDTFWNIPLG